MPKYEVAVFNQEVRDCVKMQEKHEGYDDEWADPHYIEVSAVDEDGARAKVNRQYPPNHGFVITDISKVTDDTF